MSNQYTTTNIMKKMTILGLKELSRAEMKNVMAGSGIPVGCSNNKSCANGAYRSPCLSGNGTGGNCYCPNNPVGNFYCV